jgi:hypothetical protein
LAVIHPLQYELESARHSDSQHRASQQRLVAEAEQLAAVRTRSTQALSLVAARMRGYVSTALRMEALRHAKG